MALSSWIRSALARLSFFSRPVPLVSSLVVVILGIFIWEYTTHPEWFGSYSPEGTGPSDDIDLSGLTPEEQAAVANIDNLTVLLNELGAAADGRPNLQAVPDNPAEAPNSLLQELLALSEPVDEEPASASTSPFDQYLSQYQFLGQAVPADGGQANGASSLPIALEFRPSASQSIEDRTVASRDRISPLEQALQQLQGGQSPETGQTSPSTATTAAGGTEPTSDSPNTTPGMGSQGVMIPGIPFPVLPTTPQMSPPPGTTGYTPPASLPAVPAAPGSGGPGTASGFPTPGAPLPPSSSGIPTIPSAPGNLTLGTPQVDVSNGYTSPYTAPSSSVNPTAVPTVPPAPFSAPRPPGSYIGGGYINTFSNPSAPPSNN